MSIKQKLLSGFGILLIVIASLGSYVYVGINKFDEISDKKAASFEQLVDLEIIQNINTSMALEAMDLIVDKNAGLVSDEYTNNINLLFKKIFEFETELKEDADGRKDKLDLINEFISDYKIFEKTLKKDLPFLVVNIENTSNKDFDKMDDFIDGFVNEVEEDILLLKTMIKEDLELASIAEESFAKQIKLFIILSVLISLIIATGISLYLVKYISSSLENFQKGLLDFFKYLNAEIDDVKLLDDSAKDEIGDISKVVNKNIIITKTGIEEDRKFINETIAVLSEFEQGDLCQRITTNVENKSLMELKKVLDSMGNQMEINIDNVLTILEEYSNHNYLNKVNNSKVKNQLLDLSNGVNTLGESITKILIENKRNGLTLEDTSDNLLENVNILNKNSTETAASLEETAAALEEITSTIVSNTENVSEMAEFVNKVVISVEEGNDLANQTTKSMDEINEQVTAINEAISIIDQIAFQTNILSLNAAVEAATAGEAGKGFAVVAQEVRNLATRSAEAAKEIKSLVENANNKTNAGKHISNKMINGFTELQKNVNKTIELIANVETASKEQQQGIEQINDAVTNQDQQTQQIANIAMQTQNVANNTALISKRIVANANAKEFRGKDQVSSASSNIIVENKDINEQTVKKERVSNKKEVEWESF
jgi:methyl-accepting chemotaxis protein